MGIFNRLTRSSTKSETQQSIEKGITYQNMSAVGGYDWLSTHYDFYKGSAYDNAYPSIKAISNAFIKIRPYAIDIKGNKMASSRLTDVLARPNRHMSGAEFREALAVSALTNRKTYILVWHSEHSQAIAGGNITRDNITGFTFMQNAHICVSDTGVKTYKLLNDKGIVVKEFSEKEVIEITSGVDPNDLDAGYSPSVAVKKWANVDDYIVDYQAGFFENGAVPSGQFIITAGSVKQFNDIVSTMQRKHRSSGNNNNVMYVHKPISQDGISMPAQVEWQPFSQQNNQLGLKEIFDETNKKIDSAFGVPSSIRGVNDNNTYASVKVDEQIFVKYTVEPFATKIWGKFVAEINRITGGLGYGLSFDIDIPNSEDELKVEAERKMTELNLIINAKNAGFELDSIITAFGLDEAYKGLEMAQNDNLQVEEEVQKPNETEAIPDEQDLNPKTLSHNHCTCSGCGDKSKAIDPKGIRVENSVICEFQKFTDNKMAGIIAKFNEEASKELSEEELAQLEEMLNEIPTDEEDTEEESKLAEAVAIILLAYMLSRGNKQYETGADQLLRQIGNGIITNISVDAVKEAVKTGYNITLPTEIGYRNRLAQIIKSYNDQTNQQIRSTLRAIYDKAIKTGRPVRKQEVVSELKETTKLCEWRIERIAKTEENHIRQKAQLDAMADLSAKTGIKVKKKWLALGASPCEFCQSMNGTIKVLDETFCPLMGVINGKEGGILRNTYNSMENAQAHPNCQCKLQFIFEGEPEYDND